MLYGGKEKLMKKYFLGIDNGGTACKAAVFDENGVQVCEKSTRIPLAVNSNGRTERNPEVIKEKNLELIREIMKSFDGEISAIGLSGHGKGLYMLDKEGKPLGNGIGSTDNRALEYELKWANDGTAAKAGEMTFQKVLACQPVSLLRWLKDNDRETYDRIGYVLSVNDYIGYVLTGNIAAESTAVSGTNLINLSTGEYSRELLELFGIPEMMPAMTKIIGSFESRGGITKEIAEKTGLKEGTPVAGGMFDIDACALAAGTVNENDMCMIAGTWSINEYISKKPVKGEVSMNSYYCIPGLYVAEESSAASAGNLEWVLSIAKEHSYEEINSLVEKLQPEDSNVYFFPFLFASNLNPYAQASFIGLESGSTDADIFRAVYEGVVYSGYTHLERLINSCSKKPDFIRLAGGVVNSKVWTQMFADIAGIPVKVSKSPELGCKGAAMAAGIACGVYADAKAAAEKCTGDSEMVYPNTEKTEIYRRKYSTYREIEKALAPVWKKIRNI